MSDSLFMTDMADTRIQLKATEDNLFKLSLYDPYEENSQCGVLTETMMDRVVEYYNKHRSNTDTNGKNKETTSKWSIEGLYLDDNKQLYITLINDKGDKEKLSYDATMDIIINLVEGHSDEIVEGLRTGEGVIQ